MWEGCGVVWGFLVWGGVEIHVNIVPSLLLPATFPSTPLHATSSPSTPPHATSSPSTPLPPIITNIDVLSSFMIRVSWAPVIATPSTSAYILEYKQSHNEKWTNLPPSPLCTHTLGNLLPNTSYLLRVFAVNSMGEGMPSPIYSIKTRARGMWVWPCVGVVMSGCVLSLSP